MTCFYQEKKKIKERQKGNLQIERDLKDISTRGNV